MTGIKATYSFVSDRQRFEWQMLDTVSLGGVMQQKKQRLRQLENSYRTNEDDSELRYIRKELKELKRIMDSRQIAMKLF